MAINFEEAAIAFAQQLLRAQQAEQKVAELEKQIKELKASKPIEGPEEK